MAEKKYTVIEHELLAVVFSCEKFRSYLLGTKVIVHDDHSSLIYVMTNKDAKSRLIRLVLSLQEFEFVVKDRRGKKMRLPIICLDFRKKLCSSYEIRLKSMMIIRMKSILSSSHNLIHWLTNFAY